MGLHLIAAAWNWWSFETWLYILMAAVGLGMVIFVHELGHFIVAKLCGVKCEKFYIGFDVPIRIGSLRLPAALWKRQWGETEYGIGIIPLGGYVKMLGQDDNPSHAKQAADASRSSGTAADGTAADGTNAKGANSDGTAAEPLDPRSYPAKSVPQRMAIISAGVVMNIIFAFIFALAAVWIGIPYVPCIILHTLPGEPAWQAHLRERDEIIDINGLKKPRWDDLQLAVLLSNRINLGIDRTEPDGKAEKFSLTLQRTKDYVGPRDMPRIGVALLNTITLADAPPIPYTPVHKLSEAFHDGDKIVAIDGQPIADAFDYQKILARNPSKTLKVTVERAAENDPQKPAAHARRPDAGAVPPTRRVTIDVPPNPWCDLGVAMTMGPIAVVQQDSPATRATSPTVEGGLKPGDRILSIDGKPAGDPLTLPMRLVPLFGKQVKIEVQRPAAENGKAPPQKIEFATTLSKPAWFAESQFEDSPVGLLPLGAAYGVETRVSAVDPKGPAAKSGLLPGDEILQAEVIPMPNPKTPEDKQEVEALKGEKPIEFGPQKSNWPSLLDALQYVNPQTRVRLTVSSGGKKRTVELALAPTEYFNPLRGFKFEPNEKRLVVHSVGEATTFAWRETKGKLLAVYIFLRKLAAGDISPMMLGGPGTIAYAAAKSAQAGPGKLLLFLTLLSANLAVVNFLPIPILDGGHMMFLLLEAIFRRPVSEKIVVPLTYAGLLLILSLMVFVGGLDVHRFWPF